MIKHLPLNRLGRDFVVGDIHGCIDQVNLLLEHVKFNKLHDRLIAVGDLVDRGPASLEILRLLTQPWFHSVAGNHEVMMVQYLKEPSSAYHNIWVDNGGIWYSYLDYEQKQEILLDYLKILADLPAMIVVDLPDNKRFHVIHAELQPDEVLTNATLLTRFAQLSQHLTWDGEVVYWGRSHFMHIAGKELNERDLSKFARGVELQQIDGWMDSDELSDIYVGHTPVKAPLRFRKLVNIDNHAYHLYTGRYKRCGLVMTEPLTGKFWKAGLSEVNEVECLEVPHYE